MAEQNFHTGESSETRSHKAFARNGISFAPDWRTAVDEAIADVMCGDVTTPDLVVMFASSEWSDHFREMTFQVKAHTGCETLIGCSSSGVLADECCHESAPGLTLMAMWLPEATLTPMYLNDVPTAWPWHPQVVVENVRGIIMFSDPYRTDAQAILVGLREQCPGIPMIGALASTTRSDRHSWVYLDGEVHAGGSVAVALEGPYDLMVRVSQGGTPVGETWTITEIDHNKIHTISNRPAIEVMRKTLAAHADEGLTERDLMIGLPMDEYQDDFAREDFVGRGLLGWDEEFGTITIGGIPRQGQSIQFLKRDPKLASNDLDKQLRDLDLLEDVIVAGILSTCKGRGANMFGRADHDAQAVANALPDVPMIGLYSLGELGPVKGVPAYNAFAVALGLIVER